VTTRMDEGSDEAPSDGRLVVFLILPYKFGLNSYYRLLWASTEERGFGLMSGRFDRVVLYLIPTWGSWGGFFDTWGASASALLEDGINSQP